MTILIHRRRRAGSRTYAVWNPSRHRLSPFGPLLNRYAVLTVDETLGRRRDGRRTDVCACVCVEDVADGSCRRRRRGGRSAREVAQRSARRRRRRAVEAPARQVAPSTRPEEALPAAPRPPPSMLRLGQDEQMKRRRPSEYRTHAYPAGAARGRATRRVRISVTVTLQRCRSSSTTTINA